MIDPADLAHLRHCVELAREALEAGDEPFGSRGPRPGTLQRPPQRRGLPTIEPGRTVVIAMPTTSVPWMGDRVVMWDVEGMELTALEWRRPDNGAMRGFRVLGAGELVPVCQAVEEATAELRPAPRLEGLAGRPLDLETFLDELLDR